MSENEVERHAIHAMATSKVDNTDIRYWPFAVTWFFVPVLFLILWVGLGVAIGYALLITLFGPLSLFATFYLAMARIDKTRLNQKREADLAKLRGGE